MDDKRIIKKYPNRRLYDTKNSLYVTLNDLSDIIRQGSTVEVRDAKTGDDVTAFILTQIVMNKAKANNTLLPVSLLHTVIQFGENLLHEFFENYFETTIKNYLAYRKKMDDQLKAYMDIGMDFSNMAEKTFQGLDPFKIISGSSPQDEENSSTIKESNTTGKNDE